MAGTIPLTPDAGRMVVVPLIDGAVCGEDLSGGHIGGPERGYHVVVDSQQRVAGCGTPGKVISLQLMAMDGDTPVSLGITIATVDWLAGSTVEASPWGDATTPTP